MISSAWNYVLFDNCFKIRFYHVSHLFHFELTIAEFFIAATCILSRLRLFGGNVSTNRNHVLRRSSAVSDVDRNAVHALRVDDASFLVVSDDLSVRCRRPTWKDDKLFVFEPDDAVSLIGRVFVTTSGSCRELFLFTYMTFCVFF